MYSIALEELHTCSPQCATTYARQCTGNYVKVPRPADQVGSGGTSCKKHMTRQPSSCHVAEWGSLCGQRNDQQDILDIGEVVIADTLIKVPFSYPLSRHHTFTYRSAEGFTRGQLLRLISTQYRDIYATEQMTDHPTSSKLSRTYVIVDGTSECPMCLTPISLDSVVPKLSCGHVFHSECIATRAKKCPVCRDIGTRGLLNRPQSGGFWGIWGHDIGDLFIEALEYDPATHVLSMHIGS